jgi:hypothetical protein
MEWTTGFTPLVGLICHRVQGSAGPTCHTYHLHPHPHSTLLDPDGTFLLPSPPPAGRSSRRLPVGRELRRLGARAPPDEGASDGGPQAPPTAGPSYRRSRAVSDGRQRARAPPGRGASSLLLRARYSTDGRRRRSEYETEPGWARSVP